MSVSKQGKALKSDQDGSLEHEQLLSYLQGLASAMLLGDWLLELSFDPYLTDASAKVDSPLFQRRATVTLGAPFLDEGPEDRRDTLVHELLHLVVMPAWQYTDELLEQEMSSKTARVAWLAFTGHMESSIDHLARLMAPGMPLPPPYNARGGGPSETEVAPS